MRIWNPQSGRDILLEEQLRYEVSLAAMSITALKNNILYVGVDNPILIATNNISSNDLELKVTGIEKLEIKRRGAGHYYDIKPLESLNRHESIYLEIWNKETQDKLGSIPFSTL